MLAQGRPEAEGAEGTDKRSFSGAPWSGGLALHMGNFHRANDVGFVEMGHFGRNWGSVSKL